MSTEETTSGQKWATEDIPPLIEELPPSFVFLWLSHYTWNLFRQLHPLVSLFVLFWYLFLHPIKLYTGMQFLIGKHLSDRCGLQPVQSCCLFCFVFSFTVNRANKSHIKTKHPHKKSKQSKKNKKTKLIYWDQFSICHPILSDGLNRKNVFGSSETLNCLLVRTAQKKTASRDQKRLVWELHLFWSFLSGYKGYRRCWLFLRHPPPSARPAPLPSRSAARRQLPSFRSFTGHARETL